MEKSWCTQMPKMQVNQAFPQVWFARAVPLPPITRAIAKAVATQPDLNVARVALPAAMPAFSLHEVV